MDSRNHHGKNVIADLASRNSSQIIDNNLKITKQFSRDWIKDSMNRLYI